MLRSRIIPCLLIHKNGLVKTINFKDPKYVGDPINAVKIFNEKKVDEIMVLDIDASVQGNEPNYELISKLANECRMPLCYGGGVKNTEQIKRIVELGVEKVSISSAACENPDLVSEASSIVGNQSVVVVADVKKKLFREKYELHTHNGNKRIEKDLFSFLKIMEDLGAGEIVINSIDRDGCMNGYDIKLISKIKKNLKIPLTAIGGAGKIEDIELLINDLGTIGAAAGSLFVFKGKYRAVLINYPSFEEKDKINK